MVLVVWLNKNNRKYYYKISKQTYVSYQVGYINQYGHEVVLIVPINEFIKDEQSHINYKNILINKCICFLENMK